MAMKIFKNPAVLHYFKTDLKKNLKFFIICLALHMLSFPLLFITMTYDAINKDSSDTYFSEFFIVIAFIFTLLAILAGVLIAVNNFSYLHKKHESDTYMSLPLSDKQRFFTNYFSGLVTYILPVIISGIFSFLTHGIFVATVTSDSVKNYYISYEPIIYGNHTIHWFEGFFIIYLLAIIAMIMFYTITVFACTLCGSIFETLVHVILLNGAIPGIIALVSFVMFNKVPTMTWSTVMLPILSKTSPIGAAFSYFLYSNIINYDVLLLPFVLKFSFWLIAFTALYAGISFVLYKIRKAEDVAKPYVFKSYYYIIMTCITFAFIATIPSFWEILLAPMLVVSVVFYLIFEVITNRGFKKFGYSVIRCISTIVISFVLILILNNSWSFGIGKRVPNPEKVKSVSINYTGLGINTFTDENIIEIITDYHKDAVKDAYDNLPVTSFMEYEFDYYFSYEVTYKLKNGTSVTRYLPCNKEQSRLLAEIQTYDEYAKHVAQAFYNATYDDFIFRDIFDNDYDYVVKKDNNYKEYSYDNPIIVSEKKFEKFKKEMKKAIELDLSDRSYEQVINPYSYYGVIDEYNIRIYVYEYDENILSVLKKYGIYTTTPKKYLEENYSDTNPFNYMYISYSNDYGFYYDEEYEKTYNSYRYFNTIPSSNKEHELMLELATKLAPYNYDSEHTYILTNNYLVVPKKYEHLAKELYELGAMTPFPEWAEDEYGDEFYEDYTYVDEVPN